MIFIYLSLGLLVVFALHLLLKFLSSAQPETIGRATKYVFYGAIIVVLFLLLRFGLHHLAAILGVVSAAVPLIDRWRSAKTPSAARDDAMTVEDARDVLGVDAEATEEDIQEAHRSMLKKNHPDKGGSEYLTRQINRARDVLMKHTKKDDEP